MRTRLLTVPALALATLALGLSVIHQARAQSWITTGSLNTARDSQTATLLPNGMVLVAGGENYGSNFTVISSAELYNPASGAWTPTGSLNTPRQNHTATLMPNGMVLVAGGAISSSGVTTNSAELYNPSNGTWTVTGSLHAARANHTATLLPNGLVLVAGGANGSSALTSAELYNPSNGTWTVTGPLHTIQGGPATLLPNGMVLVAGGVNNSGGYLTTAELYNPSNGTWTVTGSLNTARNSPTATLMPNGMVLVAGGYGNAGTLVSAELYNSSNGTWTATGSLNTPRIFHTATLLPNGLVLVAGGDNLSFYPYTLASAELYNPANGTWTTTASLYNARAAHTATLLPNGLVLAAGGEGNVGEGINGFLASAELYNVGPFEITSIIQPNATDLLITWNTSGTNNIVQVTAGADASGSFSTTGFIDLTNIVVTTAMTNFYDVGAATNMPARYYRIRSPQ
jgi:N-acetylneuraminic acid mutarotase